MTFQRSRKVNGTCTLTTSIVYDWDGDFCSTHLHQKQLGNTGVPQHPHPLEPSYSVWSTRSFENAWKIKNADPLKVTPDLLSQRIWLLTRGSHLHAFYSLRCSDLEHNNFNWTYNETNGLTKEDSRKRCVPSEPVPRELGDQWVGVKIMSPHHQAGSLSREKRGFSNSP